MSELSDTQKAFLTRIQNALEPAAKYAESASGYVTGAIDAALDAINNPPVLTTKMSDAECIDCVKALAPTQKIIDCLKGGGLVFCLWGTPNQIANAALLRVTHAELSYIVARPVTITPTLVWSEGKDKELARPDKYILRIMLFQKLSA